MRPEAEPPSYWSTDRAEVQLIAEREVPSDIRRALEVWHVYDAFGALPDEEQVAFIAWVDQSGDERQRQHRIDLLTIALKNAR